MVKVQSMSLLKRHITSIPVVRVEGYDDAFAGKGRLHLFGECRLARTCSSADENEDQYHQFFKFQGTTVATMKRTLLSKESLNLRAHPRDVIVSEERR